MVSFGKTLLVILGLSACSKPDYTIDWQATLPDSVYADVDLDTRHIRINALVRQPSFSRATKPMMILRDHERCHLVMNDAGIIWPDIDSLGYSKTEEKVCDAMARFMNR